MRHTWWLALLAMALPSLAHAQAGNTVMFHGTGAPTGTCAYIFLYTDDATGNLWNCKTGVWSQAGSGGGGGSPGTTPNQSAWYVSRNCGSQTNCTTIKGDGRYVVDATSNSSTTITCPNNDCNFTQADVGKKVWATTQGSGVGIGYLIYTTYVCPVTTISTVNSAQSITVGTTCTASGTANVALYWATDDGTALSGLDATVGCSAVYLPDAGIPGNFILTSQPFLVTAPSASVCNQQITTSVGAPAPALIGTGFGASQTVLMISPDFVWANCKAISGASQNVCIGGTARSIANLQILGSGLTSATNANCSTNKIVLSAAPVSSVIYGVDVAGICPGATGMRGIELNSADENLDLGGAQEVGAVACAVHGTISGVVFREDDCHNLNVSGGNGLVVDAGSQASDFGTFIQSAALINGTFTSYGTHFVEGNAAASAVVVGTGGTWFSYGDFIGTDTAFTAPTNAVQIGTGGQVQLANTNIKASGNSIINTSSGTVISLGGNKLQALPLAGSTGKWTGVGVLTGTCRGTATSSATLGLYLLGQNATANCTSTTVNLGQMVTIVPLSGSVFGLAVSAGTGCKSGNTCVFTVLKNGSATTLTCSMVGPASSCFDNSHFDIPTAGDTYSVQFTTGATETLANVTATLLAW